MDILNEVISQSVTKEVAEAQKPLSAQGLIQILQTRFGSSILKMQEITSGKIFLTVPKELLTQVAGYLFQDLGARFLITAGTDRRLWEGDFQVTHFFSLDADHLFIALQVEVAPGDEQVPSITPQVPAANWAEREMRDVLGIEPVAHPDPRRLVLADDWPEGIHPLRKDFPCDFKPPSTPEARPRFKEPPEGTTVIPIGPFYPVLEEPAHLRLFVDGERIVDCDYRGFYNHRGIEKLGDSVLNYNEICFVAERICGICGMIHSTCYCQTVEEAAGIEIPKRAKYIRTILLELERIHSHLLWIGIAAHIIGFDTVLMQSWRIREPVMWLCELITGNRKTYGVNLIGGVRRDIPKELHPKILEVLDKIEKESRELISAVPGDTTLMMRLKDVGFLTEEEARRICVVGPTARGSNVKIDARADHPYAAYEEIEFKVAVQPGGDILARTLVRAEELFESIAIVRKALEQMPEGPIMAKVQEEIPPGLEGVTTIEAPRGEAIHYVLTGENNRPERWRVRAPTYANLQAIPIMIQGETIADVPITLGSIDPCFSCTERVEVADVRSGQVRIYTQEELLRMVRERKGF